MKTSRISKAFIVTLMCAVISGCGKDKSSSSAPAPAPAPAPVQNPVVEAPPAPAPAPAPVVATSTVLSGQQALDSALAWYKSTTEPTTTTGSRAETRKIEIYPDNCKSKTVLWIFTGTICGSTSGPAVTFENRTVEVTANPNKSENPKLAAVFSPMNMALGQVTQVPKSDGGALITFTYVKPNNYTVEYIIDTSFHSAFNPVQVTDSELRRKEVIMNPQLLK
jgi:hypothetical protein